MVIQICYLILNSQKNGIFGEVMEEVMKNDKIFKKKCLFAALLTFSVLQYLGKKNDKKE